jgi:hypothetical protein
MKSIILIPLLFLSSCTIDWNDEKVQSQVGISKEAINAEITLKEEKNSVNLLYKWEEIIGWFYTDDKNPPLPSFILWSCDELRESLLIQSGSTMENIWSGMTYKWKRDCIKQNTLENITIGMSWSDFALVSWITKYPNQKFLINLKNTTDVKILQ